MYEECRKKYMEKIMKEFEVGKLKLRNNTIVKDRKQAIAIAISIAQHKCIFTKNELEHVETKVMNFLLEDNRKIARNRIPLTNVIDTRILIKNYLRLKNRTKAHKLYMLLVERITLAAVHKIKVDMNIWEELHMIQNMLSSK